MSETLKVVFDTQIYLRAVINADSISGRLFSEWTSFYILHTTTVIDAEIIGVLNRPKIRAKYPQITDNTVEKVKAILEKAERVEVAPDDIEPVCRDPKDDIFLACAKVAGATYLVSEDKDLLVLGQHHKAKIVQVLQFLEVLDQSQAEQSSNEDVDQNRVDE